MKLVAIGKDRKSQSFKGKKQIVFLSIITTIKERGWIRRFLKIGSTSILFWKFGLLGKREDYHRKKLCC